MPCGLTSTWEGSIRRKTGAVFAAVLVATMLSPVTAGAAIREGDLRIRMVRIQRSLNALAERLHRAEESLHAAEARIKTHQRAIERARKLLAPLQASLNERAAQMYILGSGGFLEGALGSDDLGSFLDRFSYLEQVSDGEQGLYEQLRAVQRRSRQESKLLRAAFSDASKARAALLARRATLDRQFTEYQGLLDLVRLNERGAFSRASRTRAPAGFQCPVAGPRALLNNYGDPRPGGAHTGVDISSPYGTPVVAVLSGTIAEKPTGGWWGLGIILRDAAGNEWYYAHLSARAVSVGERVAGGERIGRVGCSGSCTGPHLHFEYHPGGGGPVSPYRILSRAC